MLSLTPFWRLAVIETSAVLLLAIVARTIPASNLRWLRQFEISFDKVARRRVFSVVLVIVFVLIGRMSYWHWAKTPMPSTNDEFSYLLAGDTFASGRLTNPTHPMWEHFESFHILQRPSYQSMYPVAQGIVLAAGQVLFGNPWFGVLLSSALMCGAFVWMLQGWLPPRWALIGGILVAVRIGIFSYWVNSYWGGAPAAIGGALVLGAWPRICARARTVDALWMALGLGILANSRPYEGLLVSIPIAIAAILWMRSTDSPELGALSRKLILPIAIVLAVTAALMLTYFHAVTGSALQMPFSVNRKMYAVANIFIFQKPNTVPIYRHEIMRTFYMDWEYPLYLAARTFPGWLDLVAGKLRDIWAFFLGAALSLPLIIAPQVWRNRRVRLLLVCCLMVLAGSSLVWWSTPHYFAPAACALFALVLQSLRYLRSQRRRSSGLILAWGIPILCVLTIPLQPAVRQLAGDVQIHSFADWWTVNHQMLERLEVARTVQTAAKKNLIIVRYSSKHNSLNEWVYNRANIDSAPIVWAHDMDPAKNRELIDYFKDRKVWLLEPDFDQPRLTPYPSE